MYDVCLKLLQMLHMVLLRGFTYLVHRGGGSRGTRGPGGRSMASRFFRNRKVSRAEREIYYCCPPPLRICGPSAVSGTDFHCVSSLSKKCNQFLTLFAIFSRFFRRHLFKWSKNHDFTFKYCWEIHYFIVLLNFLMTMHLSIDKQRFLDLLILIENFFHLMPIADD